MPFPPAHPSLLKAIAEREYLEPTPVQAAVLTADAGERDLLVSAQTGSGKTVAYGLAIAPTLLGEAERFPAKTPPLALVVAPTRELALQVQRELSWLYAATGARIVSCVGGMDVRREGAELFRGAHIVVGTPGRLCDHLERGRLDLAHLKCVILDEADEMLDLGFKDALEQILDATPKDRRTLLFSATIPKGIAMLARAYQKDALRIATSADSEAHGDIEYRAVSIAGRERDHAVVNVLRYLDARGALVFCTTREGVNHLHRNLLERGFSVVSLSGELSQRDRTHALQALRDGRARVCVATDVAARGLDLPDLGLVIHADLPRDKATLLHRSGRTGRAGRKGTCVLLVPHPARRHVERLFDIANIDAIWSPPPSVEQIRTHDQERLVREVAALAQEPAEEDVAAAKALLAERSAEEVAAALIRFHRQLLPAAEEIGDNAAPSRAPVRTERSERPERTDRAPDRGPPARDRPRPAIDRGPRAHHDEPSDMVMFRINVGRIRNANPKWLVPLICRRGGITKADIGKINVMLRETQFEITARAAAAFTAAARLPDEKEPSVVIQPLIVDQSGVTRPRPPRVSSPR